MEEDIIAMYRCAGYTPESMIIELIGLVGAAIISNKSEIADYSNDKYDVKVIVTEK